MLAHRVHHATFQGHERTYFLQPCVTPRLAVVLLHPTASSGKAMAAGGGWLKIEDIAILAPDGLPKDPVQERCDANPRCWSSEEEPARGRQVDDLGFIDFLIERFLADLPPGTPLILVGHSNGCSMGFRVLAESGHRVRFGAAVLYAAPWASEKAPLRTPILYMVGDCDPIRPFHGNVQVKTPWFSMRALPIMETVRDCLAQIGAQPHMPSVDPAQGFVSMRWTTGAAPFEFRILEGHGHHWPTGEPLDPKLVSLLGPNNESLDATAMALRFAQEHLGAHAAA